MSPSKKKIFFKLFGFQVGDIAKVRNLKNVIADEWRGKLVEIKSREYHVMCLEGNWYECERLDTNRPDEWTNGWLHESHLIYMVKENECASKFRRADKTDSKD